MSIWKTKPLSVLLNEASEDEKGLKETLSARSLVALGVGAIIGAIYFH
jgi:APA family basic amino acid/polyamine antiporter